VDAAPAQLVDVRWRCSRGHGVTPFLQAAQAASGKTANGDHMVEPALDVMVEFMLQDVQR
jgi:hypothetical protein